MKDKNEFVDQLVKLIERYIDDQVEARYEKKVLTLDFNPCEREDVEVNKNTTLKALPEILNAQNIAEYLGISRKRVYELFHINSSNGGIPNFSIGATRRVDKVDFIKWIEQLKVE